MDQQAEQFEPRRRLLGGYRRSDVDRALNELRSSLAQSEAALASACRRGGELEADLATARTELETHRAREYELAQAMLSAHRRANEVESAAAERARTIQAEAEEHAAAVRADVAQKTGESTRQVEELLRVKDSLLQTMRCVIRDFDTAVSRVERGEPALPQHQPQPLPPAPPAVEPAQPPAALALVAPPDEPPAELLAPPAPHDATPGGPVEHSYQPGLEPDLVFDTQVEVDAGPFADFTALSAFERALARLPKVEDVYVRRLDGDRATVELLLAEPEPLLVAMREFLPYSLSVASAERGRLSVTIETHAAAAR